jgi:hypothetical protein
MINHLINQIKKDTTNINIFVCGFYRSDKYKLYFNLNGVDYAIIYGKYDQLTWIELTYLLTELRVGITLALEDYNNFNFGIIKNALYYNNKYGRFMTAK